MYDMYKKVIQNFMWKLNEEQKGQVKYYLLSIITKHNFHITYLLVHFLLAA